MKCQQFKGNDRRLNLLENFGDMMYYVGMDIHIKACMA